MTRIWIEFDDLDALKDNLTRIEWWHYCGFMAGILAKIGYHMGKKTDTEILNIIREYCTRYWDQERGGHVIYESISQEDKDSFNSLADDIIKALKDKGDVR